MSWQPSQYLRYSGERLRPAIDLLARVPLENPRRIYDLGCGTGNVTQLLLDRWPAAQVTGVDSSESMLAEARKRSGRICWHAGNLNEWQPDDAADLIFSNAALHWLPDHARLLPRLLGHLADGGALAVQMPGNFLEPSHTVVTDTVLEGRWRDRLESLLIPNPVSTADVYYDMLAPFAQQVDVWETRYWHPLEGVDAVKEWIKGSWLKQFLDRLDGPDRESFEAEYAQRVRQAYPIRADGTTLFPFRRVFFVAIVARRGN